MFFQRKTENKEKSFSEQLAAVRTALNKADAVIIGAGAGLSTSAGFTYSGARFQRYFSDFAEKYGFHDMYEGGFYPYDTLEEHWAYWSRYIYINRYMDAPKPVYGKLLGLVRDKDYFVLTTNVDHCFQKAGFDKERLFYTQGDYGLWQCSVPCHHNTYDNEASVKKMVAAQGYVIGADGALIEPEGQKRAMRIPSELVPRCPICHKPMSMNLRADATFVEDNGWRAASECYQAFLERHKKGRVVFLELGVGYNTPGIIKYPFWQMAVRNKEAVYICLNLNDTVCPRELAGQSICMQGDIGAVLESL